jgi:hypothetical protein
MERPAKRLMPPYQVRGRLWIGPAIGGTDRPYPEPWRVSRRRIRYYGYYSNKSRGLRKKAGADDQVPALIESEISFKEFRKNWARLIQKIYHVNPLVCTKCSGSMRIIAFIEDEQLVKKILKHLDLWDVKRKPLPRANSPPTESFIIYDESSLPSADDPPSLLFHRCEKSAFGPVASARQVT